MHGDFGFMAVFLNRHEILAVKAVKGRVPILVGGEDLLRVPLFIDQVFSYQKGRLGR